MNKLQYRAAVQSIRWSAEKRAEIEARLRSTAGTAAQHESQWNHESDDLTVSATHADISRVEEYEMKQKRIKRILLTGFAAAILAAAGAVAATAGYAKKHPQKRNVTIGNGKPVTVCAKPNRLHKGTDYCTADGLLKGGTPQRHHAFGLKKEVRGNAEQ